MDFIAYVKKEPEKFQIQEDVNLFSSEDHEEYQITQFKTFKFDLKEKQTSFISDACQSELNDQFKCNISHSVFTTNSELVKNNEIYSTKKPFVCNICEKSFKTRGNLKIHEKTHSNVRPFICDVCNRAFNRNGQLKKHKMIHTNEKPFICDKAFRANSELKLHKIIHTSEKNFNKI